MAVLATTNDTTSFVDFYKEIYGTSIKTGIREDNPYYDLLGEADKQYVGGLGFKIPIRLGRAGNAASIGEGADLPTSGVPTSDRIEVSDTELWVRFNNTKRAIERARGSQAAFNDLFSERADSAMMEIKEQLNRQLIGNKVDTGTAGDVGVLAKISAISAGVSVTLTTNTAMQFRRGMKVATGTRAHLAAGTGATIRPLLVLDIIAKDKIVLGSLASPSVITDPNAINEFISVGSAALSTDTTLVFNSFNQELNGLSHAVDNAGTFETIDPTATGKAAWKATKQTNAVDVPLQKSHITGMFMAIKIKSGQRANCIVTHDLGLIEMQKLMESDVRYVPQTFKGGFEHELFAWNNGVKNCPVIPESNVAVGDFYFPNMDEIKMGYTMDWSWLDEDGSKASRVLNKASFEYAYGCMFQQLFFGRNSHGLLTDIVVDDSAFAAPD